MPKNSDESNQPNTNPTIKSAAKVAELNQLNENSGTKREGFQHTKARQEEYLKKKQQQSYMASIIRSMDRELISE
jgi:hypothetical protein